MLYIGGGGGMVGDGGGTSHNRICNNLKSDQMSGLKFSSVKIVVQILYKLYF